MATSVFACSCEHSYQDKNYGKGKRLCNSLANGQYKCTVCSKVHGSPKGQASSKKEETPAK